MIIRFNIAILLILALLVFISISFAEARDEAIEVADEEYNG